MPDVIGASVLIVEDDAGVRDRVVDLLRLSGFKPRCAATREEIVQAVRQGDIDAIVLDLSLPGDDGIDVAKVVRELSGVPILMLTGRAGVRARVDGLEAGADDYLVKPFHGEELTARLRAVLRRSLGRTESKVESGRSLTLGDVRLDRATGVLCGPLGETRCTELEGRLLYMLATGSGRMSREAIYREVFGRVWNPSDRSLDVHVARLRGKLDEVSRIKGMIVTLRGQGYEVRAQVSLA